MKIRVLQEDLSKALTTTSRFASPKVQLPVLANMLLKSVGNKLYIAATNLEMSISLPIGAKVEKEGEITVPTRTIVDLVNNLKPGPIEIENEKEKVKIKSQGFDSSVLGINTSDFPKIPSVLEKSDFKLNSGQLVEALNKVLFSVSTDETRPVLTGVLVIFDSDKLVLVSTDGFRLSQKTIQIDTNKKELKVILPKNMLHELLRMMGESNSVEFSYSKNDNQILFGLGGTVLTSRIINGEFPDFEKIIPKKSTWTFVTDKDELLRAVKLASVFARDSANLVKFKMKKDSIEVVAESSQYGSQSTNIDSKIISDEDIGKDFVIGFNYRFLEDFLNSCKSDDVEIGVSDPNTSAVFLDTKDKDYLHIIMPVRMQS